jgi:cell division protein FtsQ
VAKAKAKTKLTARQRAGRKINRKRQWRKWWQTSQRFFIILALVGTFSAVGGGWWFWHSGRLEQMTDAISNRFWQSTASLGFKVGHVYLEGRKYTPMADVDQALNLKMGDPILALSLSDMRARLEAVPRVKYAEVARVLPDQLHITILERQPIAVWQNEGKMHLIDNDGVVMEYIDPAQYGHLLLVVGEDAPSHAHDLLVTLAQSPELYREVASASRIGERRWNIRFKNGVELKLPEQGSNDAWQNFARIEQEQHILEHAIKSVDMRLADRVFIKLAPMQQPPKSEKQGGSET